MKSHKVSGLQTSKIGKISLCESFVVLVVETGHFKTAIISWWLLRQVISKTEIATWTKRNTYLKFRAVGWKYHTSQHFTKSTLLTNVEPNLKRQISKGNMNSEQAVSVIVTCYMQNKVKSCTLQKHAANMQNLIGSGKGIILFVKQSGVRADNCLVEPTR